MKKTPCSQQESKNLTNNPQLQPIATAATQPRNQDYRSQREPTSGLLTLTVTRRRPELVPHRPTGSHCNKEPSEP